MGVRISPSWNDPRSRIVTTALRIEGEASAIVPFPVGYDDKWRFLPWWNITFAKVNAAQNGLTWLHMHREGFDEPAGDIQTPIWSRWLWSAETTEDAGQLQGGEWQSQDDTYTASSGNVSSQGILLPPRSKLLLFENNVVITVFSGLMHEADTLDALRRVF